MSEDVMKPKAGGPSSMSGKQESSVPGAGAEMKGARSGLGDSKPMDSSMVKMEDMPKDMMAQRSGGKLKP